MKSWLDMFQGFSLPDIDKRKVENQTKDLAEDALKVTGILASWTAMGLKKGTETAIQGAKDIYQRGLDDHTKWKEIERIKSYCKEMEEDRKKRAEDFIRDFDKEQKAYNDLILTVNKQLMTYQMGMELLVERDADTLRAEAFEEYSASMDHEDKSCVSFFKQNPHITGGLAGVSTGAGAVGLMTLFGSAGTGTALSSLSGVAYIKATLAALGGGPLYAGGAGMMGGAAFLGAAILTPAAVVTGYLADKNINEGYPKAKECEVREYQIQEEAEKLFQELEKGLRQFRQLEMELYSFSGFFEELLIKMPSALKIEEHQNQFFDVLKHSAEVLHAFATIRILRGANELNTNFAKEFADLQQEEVKCKKQLDDYRRAVDPERQEFLDRYQQNTDELKNMLKDAYDKLEQVESSYQARLEEVAAHQPEKMNQIVSDLASQFHAFERQTLLMLATGEFDFRQKEDYLEQIDFGGIVIEYGKSIERIITLILKREGFDMNTIKTIKDKEPTFCDKINAFCLQPNRRTPQWVQDNLYIARQTRNLAAHQKIIRFEEARKVRGILFGVNGNTDKSLLVYLHQQLC